MRSRPELIPSDSISKSGGSFVRIADIVSAGVSPLKARRPLSIS